MGMGCISRFRFWIDASLSIFFRFFGSLGSGNEIGYTLRVYMLNPRSPMFHSISKWKVLIKPLHLIPSMCIFWRKKLHPALICTGSLPLKSSGKWYVNGFTDYMFSSNLKKNGETSTTERKRIAILYKDKKWQYQAPWLGNTVRGLPRGVCKLFWKTVQPSRIITRSTNRQGKLFEKWTGNFSFSDDIGARSRNTWFIGILSVVHSFTKMKQIDLKFIKKVLWGSISFSIIKNGILSQNRLLSIISLPCTEYSTIEKPHDGLHL